MIPHIVSCLLGSLSHNILHLFIFSIGMSNTGGTLAAIVGTVGAGFFVELVGSFKGFLLLTAFLYLSAAVFYNVYSTGERVNFDETSA